MIDSGIDATHPDLAPRIESGRSFVGGSWRKDTQGHGTFVAGIIAAETGNGEGIAGIAVGSDLLIAKVVREDGSISLDAEARAIRWAVAQGAKVINLSFGGVRDPQNPRRDTYSRLEADAIEWAVRHGVIVVAAVGNGDQAPSMPWPYASYPAALPHVIGVSALARDGSVPAFSNRDRVYNDLSAPGQEIVSTLPRQLTLQKSTCPFQGYSDCGPLEFKRAEGTSFAAPQVAAAAALLLNTAQALGVDLEPSQVAELLTRSAHDVTPTMGCRRCTYDRDRFSGWGRLDIASAIAELKEGPLPALDAYEPNDDAGMDAWRIGRGRERILASVDYWDDRYDVYRVQLRRGERIRVSVQGKAGTDTNLVLWKPGVRRIGAPASRRLMAGRSTGPGATESVRYAAKRAGWYFVQVSRCRRRGPAPTPCASTGSSAPATEKLLLGDLAELRAGLPTTSVRGGTSLSTTAPAPTNASSPTSMPGSRTAPPPIRAPRLIVGPLRSAWRFSVRPMKLSFVVTTQGAMNTSSSSVE